MRVWFWRVLVCSLLAVAARSLLALHAGRDLFLPVAGRVAGPGGVEYSTSLWITNVSAQTAHVRVEFLRGGETNPSPTPYAEVTEIKAGQTWFVDHVGEAVLRAPGAGAIRIQSDVELVASARVYSWRRDQSMAATQGVSYAAIPACFAIGRGQSSILQGVRQNDEFRYNISLVETIGYPVTLRLEPRDLVGAPLGMRELVLRAHEQRSFSIAALFPGMVVDVGVIEVAVLRGAGRVLFVGSQIAELSNDATAFEMQFPREERSAEWAMMMAAAGLVALFAAAGLVGLGWWRRRSARAAAAPAEVSDGLEVHSEVVGGGPQ